MEILKGWTNEAAVAILHGAEVLEARGKVGIKTASKKLGFVIVMRSDIGFTVTADNGLAATHITARTAAEHVVSLVGPKQAARAFEAAAKAGLFHTEAVIFSRKNADGTRDELSKTTAFAKHNKRTWGFIHRMYGTDGNCCGGDNISCLNPTLEEVLKDWEFRMQRRAARDEAGMPAQAAG